MSMLPKSPPKPWAQMTPRERAEAQERVRDANLPRWRAEAVAREQASATAALEAAAREACRKRELTQLAKNAGAFLDAITSMEDVLRATDAVVAAARRIERGCDCEYDHRCGRCDRVVTLKERIVALDALIEVKP
jgi:hypothetical protein